MLRQRRPPTIKRKGKQKTHSCHHLVFRPRPACSHALRDPVCDQQTPPPGHRRRSAAGSPSSFAPWPKPSVVHPSESFASPSSQPLFPKTVPPFRASAIPPTSSPPADERERKRGKRRARPTNARPPPIVGQRATSRSEGSQSACKHADLRSLTVAATHPPRSVD